MMRLLMTVTIACLSLAGCSTTLSNRHPVPWSEKMDQERLIVVTIRNDAPTLVPRAGSTARSYSGAAPYAVAPTTIAQSRSIAKKYQLREVTGWPIGLLGVHCLVYELDRSADRDATIERLKRDKRVESAQPLHTFKTLTDASAEPYRGLQRNLDLMNTSRAHRWSRGEGVHVAIVDTGVDITHPDLKDRIADYRDFVGGQDRRVAIDTHGTAIAGIIGARDDNAVGIVGIAPAARLHALRACWPEAGLGGARCNTLTLAKALIAAIEAKIDIVNLSLGGPPDPLLTRIVQAGLRRGIVFVGAAPSTPDNRFPTSIPGVIAVDTLQGARTADATLFAPGEDILTLAPNGSYDFFSGSSLAAASVSGGVALLLARQPKLTVDRVRSLLTSSADRGATHKTARPNQGIDLCRAITSLLREGSCD